MKRDGVFASKVALALTLAFMLPLAFGWNQASTAAMTVMFIATTAGVKESIASGLLRVVGTLMGAVIGMVLIALFPQERFLYLLSLSVVLMVLSFLYFAYQKDKTALLLTVMMIMMIFLNGVQQAFLYGVERTFMTLFGIFIYTLVFVFIFPQKKTTTSQKNSPPKERFIWLERENFKGVVQIMFIYWSSVAFWIYFNPPGGFFIVTMAVVFGLVTTRSFIKPSLLIILYSGGFLFATLMYVFVLPNLVYSWELGVFLFLYTFIAFYFLPHQLSAFFLLGLFLFNISNEIHYDFALYLTILLTFYIFLSILLFFYDFPFSTKPHHLFLEMKERFFHHAQALQNLSNTQGFLYRYHLNALQRSVALMKLWGMKIDTHFFHTFSKEKLQKVVGLCEDYIAHKVSLEECYVMMQSMKLEDLKESRF